MSITLMQKLVVVFDIYSSNFLYIFLNFRPTVDIMN